MNGRRALEDDLQVPPHRRGSAGYTRPVEPSVRDAGLPYRHTQPGVVTAVCLGAGVLLLGVLAAVAESPSERAALAAGAALLAVLAVLFASLTVTVAEGSLEVRFGPGLIGRRIAVAEIRSAKPVRNRWWYGFGVRAGLRGTMFNVSGLDAVELELASGRLFRVGTDEPERLLAALLRAGVARG